MDVPFLFTFVGYSFIIKCEEGPYMNNVNKTLYIPLYGKAYVSKRGLFLKDTKAEEIWATEGFVLKGKAKSKWLAFYMGMRSAVFDQWLKKKLDTIEDALVLHIGCGLDSRILRVDADHHLWYDVDFENVIVERKRYYTESETYHMLGCDVRSKDWVEQLPKRKCVLVVMEGVSMYLQKEDMSSLFEQLSSYFESVHLLMDCYSTFAAKASKYKNPIREVGVTTVYGVDDPRVFEDEMGIRFVQELDMTPEELMNELMGWERWLFKQLYAGRFSKMLYRLYEYKK